MVDVKSIRRPGSLKDITGQRFGRYIVLAFAGIRGRNRTFWKCRCDCGTIKDVSGDSLKSGDTKSCGCLHVETARAQGKSHRKHGMKDTKEYAIWSAMKRRCNLKTDRAYKWYGARGIKVCQRWQQSFEAFFSDMGPKPKGKSMDRIDNNGNYEPGNCRWATWAEQGNNRRGTKLYEFRGEMLPMPAISKLIGISVTTLNQRITKLGWTAERAISTPLNRH